MALKILTFSGSTRIGSLNTRLAQAAAFQLAEAGAEVTQISLADFPLPIFNGDLNNDEDRPGNVLKLARMFQNHDAAFIACPEYNSSITPLLKNTLDWVSVTKQDGNVKLNPYGGLVVGLGAASPGALGGIRGLYHVRSVLMNVGAQIVTEQCGVSNASAAFDEGGKLTDERQIGYLKNTCRSIMEMAIEGRGRG